MHHLGLTRSVLKFDHLLQTPDTFVRTVLPGMQGAAAIVHCGPATGARFTQYTAEMKSDGSLAAASAQRFCYVLAGSVSIDCDRAPQTLTPGCFVYLPQGSGNCIRAETEARLAVIEKPYVELPGISSPGVVSGDESAISPVALMGDEALQVRSLLPADSAFDFAVNTMTYAPGASLSMVEIHLMEHGLLMLEGGGIYRLGDCWYPVGAGDFIWMRAFCPQWFGALGKAPARYLIYKDWNRWALA